MIFQEILVALVFIDIFFIIYAWWDHHNQVYGNIIAALFASIISFYIAISSIIGNAVQYDPVIQSITESTINNTTTAAYIYTNTTTTFQNAGFMWLFAFIGIVMGILMILFVLSALYEMQTGDDY